MDESTKLKIKIDVFEGPFEVLFHLIEKNKVDIYDIPISEITEQYLDYIFQVQLMDLDLASEFLLMASILLHIKSKMLLPGIKKEEDSGQQGDDPREELVLRLLEYKRYKDVSGVLREKEAFWSRVSYREGELYREEYREILTPERPEVPVSREDFMSAFMAFCKREADKSNRKSDRDIKVILVKDKVTVRSKIRQISALLKKSRDFVFNEVFQRGKIRPNEMSAAFVALLVLVKTGKATVEQEKPFSDIHVKKSK